MDEEEKSLTVGDFKAGPCVQRAKPLIRVERLGENMIFVFIRTPNYVLAKTSKSRPFQLCPHFLNTVILWQETKTLPLGTVFPPRPSSYLCTNNKIVPNSLFFFFRRAGRPGCWGGALFVIIWHSYPGKAKGGKPPHPGMFVNLECCSPAAERRGRAAQGEPAADGHSSEEEKHRDTVAVEVGERGALWVMSHLQKDCKGKKKKEKTPPNLIFFQEMEHDSFPWRPDKKKKKKKKMETNWFSRAALLPNGRSAGSSFRKLNCLSTQSDELFWTGVWLDVSSHHQTGRLGGGVLRTWAVQYGLSW